MSEVSDSKSVNHETVSPISNRRILWLMVIVVVSGTLASLFFSSRLWTLGFFIGGVLSFANFFWLESSLKKMFAETSEGEYQPYHSAARYIFRYLAIGAVVGFVFFSQLLPIISVVLGLVSLAFAVLIESFIQIFSHLFKRKEF